MHYQALVFISVCFLHICVADWHSDLHSCQSSSASV